MIIGRVLSSELEHNRDDDEGRVLLLRVEVSEETDIQTVELFRQPGIDARPQADATVLIDDVGDAWQVAIACDDNIEPVVDEGEVAIYASNAGVKTSQVYCKNDGSIEAGLDNLALVAIAEKVDQIISNIMSVFSNWVPVPQDGGAALKTAWSAQFANPPTTVASTNLKAEKE